MYVSTKLKMKFINTVWQMTAIIFDFTFMIKTLHTVTKQALCKWDHFNRAKLVLEYCQYLEQKVC